MGLDSRVGVIGFYCIARASQDYSTEPRWWFSSPDLERFLTVAWRKRWDTKQIGTLIEAFGIAGGSVTSTSLINILDMLFSDYSRYWSLC